MTPQTLLLRQIHPNFVQAGRVTSQAFRPTPKDAGLLSVYDGDQIQPESAWKHFTSNPECSSAGVMAVTLAECTVQELPVVTDGVPFKEHCAIDFSAFEKTDAKNKAAFLSRFAQSRGWLFHA